MQVIEACIVAVMTVSSAFMLIYFQKDCRPLGTANITDPLRVSKELTIHVSRGNIAKFYVTYWLYIILLSVTSYIIL